jgi:hypothetical protein
MLVSSGIAAVTLAGIVYGYIRSAQTAEWSAYHLAAHSLATQRIEQTRAAKWDFQAIPPVDDLISANFPTTNDVLDIPISGTNVVYATNVTTISNISISPALKMIRVDCSWRFNTGRVFTNTIVTYRGPDQ